MRVGRERERERREREREESKEESEKRRDRGREQRGGMRGREAYLVQWHGFGLWQASSPHSSRDLRSPGRPAVRAPRPGLWTLEGVLSSRSR